MSSSKGVIKSSHVRVVNTVAPGTPAIPGGGAFQVNALIPDARKSGGTAREQTAELEAKLRQTEQEAYDRGFREGMNKGMDLQKEELRQAAGAVSVLMKELTALRQQILAEMELQIVNLAFGIAAKVIHQEVKQERTIVISVLREAVKSVMDRDGMKIRINPHDYRHIVEVKDDFLKEMDGVKNVVFEEDAAIKPGGVVVETRFGEVDARLEQQFQEIKSGFGLS